MSWPNRALVWDCETSGIDVFNDRIVQLFIGIADENGDLIERHEWLIDPGIEVPEGASDVHGFHDGVSARERAQPSDSVAGSRRGFCPVRGHPVGRIQREL